MILGITQRLEVNVAYYEIRECLALDWGRFLGAEILAAGGDFVALSYTRDFAHYADKIDGVILSGGGDLNSLNPSEKARIRDDYERGILDYCVASKMPVFGVCRGAQMIAEYFGARLEARDNHTARAHEVVFGGVGGESFEVNSFHRYCVVSLGDKLTPLAAAKDATFEAFRHESLEIYAMMWHIERESSRTTPSRMMWAAFLEAANAFADSKKREKK